MPHFDVAVQAVVVAPADLLTIDVARSDEIGDEAALGPNAAS
jgi:hypothetical protein